MRLFLVFITSARVRYVGDGGKRSHDIEIVMGCKGEGASVKACTEMFMMAACATPGLSRMCYIAGYGSFP